MKIYGPYDRKDGRKHVVIVHPCGRKQTMSYPKFLLQQKIGRELVGDETCDHVDEDFGNDALGNLQVLSRSENASKSASKQKKPSGLSLLVRNVGKTVSGN